MAGALVFVANGHFQVKRCGKQAMEVYFPAMKTIVF
jgi:hypothetical protein